MESTSCSICLEDINKLTGQVILSCQHSFHYRCIDNWFGKQVWDGHEQSCPCCRDAGKHHDRASVHELEEEDEEEEEFVEGEGEGEEDDSVSIIQEPMDEIRWERIGPGRWFVTSNNTVAYESMRSLFGPLNELVVEDDPNRGAILKIQALFRGHLVRRHRNRI